ncbi:MAG TPA: gliding motility-associated C-terminal domain-containing protein [Bacteroidales bacterium]|nr:gliding motility-associated C-terminal domain-containing protein [Bacteroidales bacterium]
MKKLLLLFLLFLFFPCKNSIAQYNYVPNPSFEEYDSIPIYGWDSIFYKYVYVPKNWFVPVDCSYAFYFNSLLNNVDTLSTGISWYGVPQNPWSYTYPYDGNAQSGFTSFTYSANEGLRNYLKIKLNNPLIIGHEYCVSFHITILDSCYIAIDQIGARFTNDSLLRHNPFGNPPCYLLENPQIVSPPGYFFNKRNIWQQVSGTFTANGGEQFMTIGNFKTDSNTNYVWLPDISGYDAGACYHIDMVSVIECDSNIKYAAAGKDTTLCLGDSIRIGSNDTLNGYQFVWSPAAGLSDSSIQNPYAMPEVTTTYQLMQSYYNSYYSSDEVTITVIDCSTPPLDTTASRVLYIPNIFSPNSDGQNDVLYIRGENIKEASLCIYNRWGEKVFETQDKNTGWDGTYKGKACPADVYIFYVSITFADGITEQRKGNITLVR